MTVSNKLIACSVLVGSLLVCNAAQAAVVYQNDFGTAAQVSEFTTVGSGFVDVAPIFSTGTVAYPAAGWDYFDGVDLDGDTLANALTLPSSVAVGAWQNHYWEGQLTINAPLGFMIDNPRLQGMAVGNNTSFGNFTALGISLDNGATWLDVKTTGGAGVSLLDLDTAGDSNYEGLTSFMIRVQLREAFNASASGNPLLENLQVTGDLQPIPEPASIGLLVAGGLALVMRFRLR